MQKRKILYIGNKLAVHGRSPTTIDVLPNLLREGGYDVHTASSKKNKVGRMISMIITFLKFRKEIDILLIDTYSTHNFYYAITLGNLARAFGINYIPILHGGNLPGRLERNKGISRNFFGSAVRNVAPSGFIYDAFKKAGYLNLTYIPNSIEIKNYPFKLREEIRPKLLWVRSFAELYNPLLALQVVEMLQNQGLKVELCMVGPEKDGSLKRCREVAASLKLPVTFTGKMEKEQWIQHSTNFDIFINTTNFDNMPVSVLEAMALGLPVVSTNVGGIPYLIADGTEGTLVPANSPKAFVDAIKKLLSSRVYIQKTSLNARRKAESFDWEAVKGQWVDLLDGV